jgi:predicted membrane-bound spermidine synthase
VTRLLCAIFFLSGMGAVSFEALWFRQAGLVFGNGVWASSLVLSSFMAGLAIGNGLAAHFAARVARPLVAYAALELVIAAAGAALVVGLPSLDTWLVPVFQPLLEVEWLANLLRVALAFALLLLPATAMGATLPLVVTSLRARDSSYGGALGLLYGWNTLGAVAGAVAAELWWLAWVGVHGAALAAAACNATAAAGAGWLARRSEPAPPAPPAPRARPDAAAIRVLAAAGVAGWILLALEVVWFRFLHLFVHAGAAAFAWMLAVVLAGIGLGGLAGGAWLRRRPDAWRHAPAVAVAAGLAAIALYAAFPRASALVAGRAPSAPLTVAWLAVSIALPVAMVSGVLFPLLGAALARRISPESTATGWLTLANTVGCALGSLAAGFALIPLLGMERSLFWLAAAYGAVAWLARVPPARPGSAWRRLAVPAVFAAALALFPFGRMQRTYLRAAVERWHGGREHVVTAVREGRSETALVVERRLAGERLNAFLLTDSFSMSATTAFARRYMKLFVWWPVALRPQPRQALLISYGVGSTAQALVATPSLARIDVVDLSREILGLSEVIHPDASDDPLRDPRVHVYVEDGRYFLAMTPRRYDLITGEPPPPKNAGVVNLYTREYFGLIHARLAEGGVATYWLPVHNLEAADARAIARAFCDAFADCALWVGHDLDWMLTGSRGGLAAPSESDFTRQWREPAVARELRAAGFEVPAQLGASFLGDAAWLAEWTAGVAPLSDAWPKRLSDRLQHDARAAFDPILDAAAARERFRDSAWIRAVWPAELRERTLAAFDLQAEINAVARGDPLGWPQRLAAVHALLGPPALSELALWRLGLTADHVAAGESARRAGRPLAPHERTLASRALVDGDPARAARGFEAARRHAPDDWGLLILELYARGRAGDRAGAAQALARSRERLPADPELRASLAWLAAELGIPVGEAS